MRDKDGYGLVPMGQTRRPKRLHRLVLEEAYGPLQPGVYALHRCDNPPCYRLGHLFAGTKAENNADKMAKGRGGYERRQPPDSRRVSDTTVAEIRSLYRPRDYRGSGSTPALALRYGLSQCTVWNIVRRRGRFSEEIAC
jgi:hypothetical protein